MTNIPLVLFLGILSTIQIHLAKALERQGIEVFDQIKVKVHKTGQPQKGGLKKPIIYIIGLLLNNTVFIWSTLAQPYGPPALFSSMFGIGLVFLIGYAASVLKEKLTRLELIGAAAIVIGTLVIGIENIAHSDIDRFTMNLNAMLVTLGAWLAISLVFVYVAGRTLNLSLVALAFGLFAGGLGSLDPFFKGVGQNYGGQPAILPSNSIGMIFFAASFVLGFLAFLVTQIGFARKVRASMLVPAYNAAFIGLPVIWQAFLLPDYVITSFTLTGMLLIISGVVVMQAFKNRPVTHEQITKNQ
jgi:drug/metabolite transporter (DMT)-like permease